jgi:hypothetical protein
MKPARLALGALGAAALVALANVERSPAARAGSRAEPVAARAQPSAEGAALEFGRAFVRQPLPGAEDAFRARSWAPPPPPPEKLAPRKPVAPPLPFSFSGVMEDAGVKTLFLRRGEALLAGREREVLESQYRIEEIGEDSVALTYLPLDERQVLAYPR